MGSKEYQHKAKFKKNAKWHVDFRRKNLEYDQRLLETPSFKLSNMNDYELIGLHQFFINATYLRDVSSNWTMRNQRFYFLLFNICNNTYHKIYIIFVVTILCLAASYLFDGVIRFQNYRFGSKALENFARKIQGDNKDIRTCVGLGDWSAQDGIKGAPNAPLKKFRKVLERKPNITVRYLPCYLLV